MRPAICVFTCNQTPPFLHLQNKRSCPVLSNRSVIVLGQLFPTLSNVQLQLLASPHCSPRPHPPILPFSLSSNKAYPSICTLYSRNLSLDNSSPEGRGKDDTNNDRTRYQRESKKTEFCVARSRWCLQLEVRLAPSTLSIKSTIAGAC